MLASEAGLRLSDRYTKVATRDLAEASPAIEKLQGAFVARPTATRAAGEQAVHVRAAACGHVAISTFQFGRSVEITPQGLADAVLVTTAIAGRAGLASSRGIYGIECGATFVSQEEDSPVFLYDPDTEVLKLRFERSRFEKFSLKLHDHIPSGRLRFDYPMSSPDASNRWTSLLRFVVATLNASPSAMEMASMEELLMMTLLSVQPSNYHIEQVGKTFKVSPRQFKQAVDYINQHLESDVRLSDIADAASCSIRSLTRTFQQASDTTPMQYLHGLRLKRVHAELLLAQSHEKTIADIAYYWGFRHLGEFNRKYRQAFGVTPSETRTNAHF
ncbi:AraC family transcriptional regulator [Janthinobacterium sp. HLX7-2]|uniref:AraC family transcriptional regulator n=1 Tax=Janthinobacterium sp. HLX7-2 TaxID=1259331 RepID=UPI003F261806